MHSPICIIDHPPVSQILTRIYITLLKKLHIRLNPRILYGQGTPPNLHAGNFTNNAIDVGPAAPLNVLHPQERLIRVGGALVRCGDRA